MNTILTSIEARLGTITLNRPEKRNAFSPELVSELTEQLRKWSHDDAVKVIRITANGPAFCAGADLAYLQQLQHFSFAENLEDSQNLKTLYATIYRYPKPVIAQVEGAALAGGAGLATVCDFVFSVPEANFGFTEVKIGFIPALVSIFLMRKIGEGKAREMLLSGQFYTAEQMKATGLVTDVIAYSEIDTKVKEFAEILKSKNSANSMKLTKDMLADFAEMTLVDSLDEAARLNAHARSSEDCKKGIAAFLSKSPINW